MQIHKARKLPVEIELVPFATFRDVDEIVAWIGPERAWYDGTHIVIATLEGNHNATLFDWIIKGVNGEFYPIKPDILAKTYETPIPVCRRQEPGDTPNDVPEEIEGWGDQ